MRRLIATAVLAVVLPLAGGCGDDAEPTASPPATTTTTTTTAAGMSVAQYTTEFDELRRTIEDAHGDYFHSKGEKAALQEVRDAYAGSAEGLAAIEPPAAAVDLHRRIVAVWRARVKALDEVLSADRFSVRRGNSLMSGATEKEGDLHDQVYTLPQ